MLGVRPAGTDVRTPAGPGSRGTRCSAASGREPSPVLWTAPDLLSAPLRANALDRAADTSSVLPRQRCPRCGPQPGEGRAGAPSTACGRQGDEGLVWAVLAESSVCTCACACACPMLALPLSDPGLEPASGVLTSLAAVGRCRAGGSRGPCLSSQGPVLVRGPSAPHTPAAAQGWGPRSGQHRVPPGWALGLAWPRGEGDSWDQSQTPACVAWPEQPQSRHGQDEGRVASVPCLGQKRVLSDVPQRAAAGPWELSGCRLAWPTPSGAGGALSHPSPMERHPARTRPRGGGTGPPLGWHRGCGQGACACGTRPPPLWGWGWQGGRVWWDLPWAAASASARPSVSPSCVWTPGCRCAVPLERSSGLAQEPLRETGRCGPKVTLFQPAGEGPDRPGRQRVCPQGSDPVPWPLAMVPGLVGVCDPQAEVLGV